MATKTNAARPKVALQGLARQVKKPVKCCRCKHVHSEDDRPRKRNRKSPIFSFTTVCPKCGAHSFYMVRADGKIAQSETEWAATLTLPSAELKNGGQ